MTFTPSGVIISSVGTGGLRGELGAGTNCLNVYTVRKVTQGIANCMKAHGYKRAAISYDSRINSDVFARATAEVFAANGVQAYITKELMPTPFLSYITRELKADIGVMLTASHNPAKYNGYKVYGADGCQLTDAGALEMTGYIDQVDIFSVSSGKFEEYLQKGEICFVDYALTESFLNEVLAMRHSGVSLIEDIKFFDIYRGVQLGEGKKSVSFSVSLRSADHTLTVEEADKAAAKILRGVERILGITIRK